MFSKIAPPTAVRIFQLFLAMQSLKPPKVAVAADLVQNTSLGRGQQDVVEYFEMLGGRVPLLRSLVRISCVSASFCGLVRNVVNSI